MSSPQPCVPTMTGAEFLDVQSGRFDQETRPNVGSFGHPDLCAKPCIFLMRGMCHRAEFCGYCHLEHRASPARLCKQDREYLGCFTAAEVVAMILPHLKSRVASLGVHHQAWDLIRALQAVAERSIGSADLQASRLHTSLQRLSISGLLSLLRRSDMIFMEDLELPCAQFRSKMAMHKFSGASLVG
ncbi:unnamed protein product [Effrenium voratum]|uniref:Uncharacterized protein n=1 Tax=Effrenium voratum TaxID=2562239 RepID=A0AA36NB30_9DINO|nr:unnamed protein product [Effrenium voratum]CAJ1405785.1 unnamed protein product [Effrenium voratum]